VGKHAASGSAPHPLVTAALAQHSGEGGAHRPERDRRNDAPVGWPGPAPSPGGGIGWPADADQADEEPAPAGPIAPAA
jgi:hypothetical protein